MDNRTEQLADGVWRVEVGAFVNAYVLADDGRGDGEGLTVVDTGTGGGGPRLVRSIRLAGLDPRAVGTVLLTHWHPDHTGSAARFARSSAAPRVLAGAGDLPAVQGRDPRPQRRARPGDVGRAGRLLAGILTPGPPVPAAGALDHGDRLETGGGIEVVGAPGHTAGSVAFWLPRRGVLLAGDAVFNVLWLSRGPGAVRSCRSREAATLRRLSELPVDVLAPGHGPPVTVRARQRLAGLAGRVAGGRP